MTHTMQIFISGPGGLGINTGSLTPPPPAVSLGMFGPAGTRGHMGNGVANDRFNSQQQQQQQAMMAAVAAATGMRTALFGAAAAAAAAAAAGQPGGAINGIFGGKARHNSIEKPAPNRSRLLEDFRSVYTGCNGLVGLHFYQDFTI